MPQTRSRPSDLLPYVIAAVTQAGAMLRREFHRTGGPRGCGGHAPVDLAVERFLEQRLLAEHPCGWLGEETEPQAGGGAERWVVDPHDGTSDFLAGRRGSAISVALLRDGQPVLGVVFAPLAPDDRGDLVAWAEGAPLTRNGEPVIAPARGAFATIALNASAGDYALHNHQALPGVRIRAVPSPAYRLALAAVGEVDAGASLVKGLAPWDIAGGHALLRGAGKALHDLRGEPIDYRRDAFAGCVGGDDAVVRRILAARLGGGAAVPREPVRTPRPVSDPGRLSRAQGCLLGQLAGDALGSAVEFETARQISAKFPNGVRLLSDGGTWNLIAGQPTDDSEMALALARALVAGREFSADAVARAYSQWRRSGPFDIGATTSTGISALEGQGSPNAASQANGALMRTSPIGILAAGDPERAAWMAAKDAALTHPHPVCQAASAAFAAAIATGVAGGDARRMMEVAQDSAGTGEGAVIVRRTLAAARDEGPADFQRNMGWVLTALQNAFHWLATGAALEEAVIATVSRGGDTDTNAAICGALLGARLGRNSVPLQWRNAILTCRPVTGDGVQHPRPKAYWPDDALELAEALLASGRRASDVAAP